VTWPYTLTSEPTSSNLERLQHSSTPEVLHEQRQFHETRIRERVRQFCTAVRWCVAEVGDPALHVST
jgi:hypothetical protein